MPSGASSSSSGSSSSQEQKAHNDLYDQNESADQQQEPAGPGTKSAASSSSQATSHSSSQATGNADSNYPTDPSKAQLEDTKPSASEFYRSLPKPLRHRMNQLAIMQQNQQFSLIPLNRLNAFAGVPISPFAAAMASSQMQRIPMLHHSSGADLGGQQDYGHADSEGQSDLQDMAASQANEQMVAPDAGSQADRQRLLLLRQMQLQHQQGLLDEQALVARQKQMYDLLRAASVARRQQEAAAAQLAGSRAILVQAHQMGLMPAASTMPTNEQLRVAQLIRQRRQIQQLLG